MMYSITRLELFTIRDALQSILEEEDYDTGDIEEGLEIVWALLDGDSFILVQGDNDE